MTRLEFFEPPYGLRPERVFDLAPVEGVAGLFTLTAEARAEARLFVLDVAVHLPSYRPSIPRLDLEGFGPDAGELGILVVVNPTGHETTVNLAAPILTSTTAGLARQVILEAGGWPLRMPLAELLAA